MSDYLAEYRHNADGSVDEIVTPATYVHLEQVDDYHWWLGVTLPDDTLLHVGLWTPRTRIRCSYWEDRKPTDHRENARPLVAGGEFGTRTIYETNHPRVNVGP